MTEQLALDGSAHELGEVRSHRRAPPPLTAIQARVMAMVRDQGSIRTVEAGVIAHEVRGRCATDGARWSGFEGKGVGCCPYAAVDGLEVLNRLAARGLVARTGERGRWAPPT